MSDNWGHHMKYIDQNRKVMHLIDFGIKIWVLGLKCSILLIFK